MKAQSQGEQCDEIARIILPWGGKLLNYCPVHANQIAMLANAMGSPVRAQLLPDTSRIQCQSKTPLTEEEKEINKQFSTLQP